MKRVLYAWEGENRIGVFEESESGDVSLAVAMLSPSLRDAMRDSVLKANKRMQ